MSEKRTSRLRFYLATVAVFWEMAHLAWEQLNGGVQSHHFLAMEEMPAISNWWGLLLLPILVWFLAGSIQKRIDFQSNGKGSKSQVLTSVLVGGIASLIFGILLSFFFTSGNEDITSYLFFGMLLLALILPIYRAECLLGFVLGMTFTFGTVLPAFIGSIVAALSAFVHLYIIPGLARLWTWSKRKN